MTELDIALRAMLRDYRMDHGGGDLEMQPAIYRALAELAARKDWNTARI